MLGTCSLYQKASSLIHLIVHMLPFCLTRRNTHVIISIPRLVMPKFDNVNWLKQIVSGRLKQETSALHRSTGVAVGYASRRSE